MTQKDLADALGISRDMVASYEGDRARIYDDMVLKLAQIFSISTDALLGAQILSPESTLPLTPNLVRRMRAIQALPPFQQKSLLLTIDTFLKGAGINSEE